MSSIKKDILIRFGVIYFIIVLGFLAVVWKIVVIQYVEGDKWRELSKQNKKEDITVYANRGNIYSSDGRLMASSIPYYKLYWDFSVEPLNSSKLYENIDSLSYCLSKKLKDKSAAQYKNEILRAYHRMNSRGKRNTRYLIYSQEVSFVDLKEIEKFPLFREGPFSSGFYTEKRTVRVRPFGSLAARTVGHIYKSNGQGRTGIELYCNEVLTGKNGVSTRKKVAGRRMPINEIDPIDGIDVVTTINVEMQDIAEKALREKLVALSAKEGCAILMEVKTGEVKAIANLVGAEDGNYYESKNIAVANMSEPGSTFKVASMIVALEEGLVKPTDTIDVGNGIYQFHGTPMKDHNVEHGGYGKLSVAEVLQNSSNVGISRIINDYYKDYPEKFVDRIYSMKLNERVEFEIPGSGAPYIPHPKDKSVIWDKTKLPWMSIGYNTKIPPIYTLMFFNAIANEGKMIQPFFVKAHSKNGNVIESFQTKTICPAICSSSTLNMIKPMLEGVVEKGTAKNVKSNSFKIAGKTGTAQINYASKDRTVMRHQVSFCGYFPADDPQYSCIVVIWGPKTSSVSGGLMAGSVFKEIAERVYAKNAKILPIVATMDTTRLHTPVSKNGKYEDLKTLFSYFDIEVSGEAKDGDWIRTSVDTNSVNINKINMYKDLVPNVIGMGAKDAVFLMESTGVKVRLVGKGSVAQQSLMPGQHIVKGSQITLILR